MPRSGGAFANRYFVVIAVSALLCALIHRSAWNRNSPKFGCSRGGLLTLRSVLLEHVTYILHQSFELPHLFLTKLLNAFVLYARYDLISYPPQLPSSLR